MVVMLDGVAGFHLLRRSESGFLIEEMVIGVIELVSVPFGPDA